MRIVYVTVSFPFGFGEEFILPEVRELISQGHEVLVVPRSADGSFAYPADAWLQKVSCDKPIICACVLWSALLELLQKPRKSIGALIMLLKSNELTTLWKNLVVYPKGLWLARLAQRFGADHIHAHWASTTSSMALIASRVSGIPWSFTAHRGDIAANNLFELKLQEAAFVRFISMSGTAMAASLCVGGLRGKERLIHMGVDMPREESGVDAVEPTIVCAAILYAVKGHRFLFEAIALLRNRGVQPVLEVIGDGPLRGELEALAKSLAIDQCVRFVGYILHDELLGLYSTSRVGMAVLPSVDLGSNVCEGIPVSLMEAMSYGVPTISTTTGGIPELLEGGAGILVPPADPSALANAIESLIRDRHFARRLGTLGRQRVAKDFNVSISVRRLVECMKPATGVPL